MSESNVSRKIDNLRIGNDLSIKDDLTVGGDVSVTGSISGYRAESTTAFTASTGGALNADVNTVYHQANLSGDKTITLPTAANCSKGDFIKIILVGKVDDGKKLIISAAEKFAIGSTSIVPGIGGSRVSVIDVSVDADVKYTITGKDKGDGGVGSTIDCVFNGSRWELRAIVNAQGDGTVASTGTVFA